jgi:hypothetical protein
MVDVKWYLQTINGNFCYRCTNVLCISIYCDSYKSTNSICRQVISFRWQSCSGAFPANGTLVKVLPSFEDLHCLYPYELEQGSLVVFLQQLQPMLYVIWLHLKLHMLQLVWRQFQMLYLLYTYRAEFSRVQ